MEYEDKLEYLFKLNEAMFEEDKQQKDMLFKKEKKTRIKKK